MNILEFAKQAGVSTATISRAFHEPQKLRAKTRDRILTLAHELGYYPDVSGRALKRGRHDVVGLIWPLEVEGAEAEFAQRVLAALTRHLVQKDLDLLVCPVDRRDPKTLEHAQRTFQRSRCDAWILLYPRRQDTWMQSLKQARKPVVCLMGKLPEHPEWKSVCLNQETWMRDALKRLKVAGCKCVRLFGARVGEPDHEERQRVFEREASKYFGKRSAVTLEGEKLRNELQVDGVDGVLCVDDQMALRCLEICREEKLAVPDAIKVVGMDDRVQTSHSQPPLSSYRQPLEQMTECALQLALGLRKHSREFQAMFVPRDSLPGV